MHICLALEVVSLPLFSKVILTCRRLAMSTKFNDRKTAALVESSGLFVFRRNKEPSRHVEFLLMLSGANNWTPPKGHLEENESAIEAAYRETEEESGLKKESIKVYDDAKIVMNYNNQYGRPKVVTYWLAELTDANATVRISHEHVKYNWFTVEEAVAATPYDDMKSAIHSAYKKVQELGNN